MNPCNYIWNTEDEPESLQVLFHLDITLVISDITSGNIAEV